MLMRLAVMPEDEEAGKVAQASGSRKRLEEGGGGRGVAPEPSSPSDQPLDSNHLFWVPASMHPEISPADFRRFLQDHASRAVREHQDAQDFGDHSQSGSTIVASSAHPVEALKQRSTSIARRGSTLRRQYRPEADDDAGETPSFVTGRGVGRQLSQRSNYQSEVPHLSVEDLQKLERLAEEASMSSDPAELRSVLRRTMSMNVAASTLDQVDALPPENEQDAPLIVPRPGQILRRAARTKIRKSSFSTDEVPASGSWSSGSRRRRGPMGSLTRAAPRSAKTTYVDGAERGPVTLHDDGPIIDRHGDALGEEKRPQSARTSEGNLDKDSRESYASDETQRTSVTSLADSNMSGSNSRETLSDLSSAFTHTPAQPRFTNPSGPTVQGRSNSASEILRDEDVSIKLSSQDQKDAYQNEPLEDKANVVNRAEGHAPNRIPEALPSASASSRLPITPISVQRVPPTPAFEKTRPAPQPPVTLSGKDHSASTAVVQRQNQALVEESGVPGFVPSSSNGREKNEHSIIRAETMPNFATSSKESVGVMQMRPPAKEKEKKGGFGFQWLANWAKDDEGTEKASRKAKKEKREKERDQSHEGLTAGASGPLTVGTNEKERERDSSGFLGALFGKRKGQDETVRPEYGSQMYGAATGMAHLTAGSLLDIHGKSMSGQLYYHRYPIHIERAIYRLSHIKLANPRRPLYEQVLISNLMFWYLSVINQPQQQKQQQQQQQLLPQPQTQQLLEQQENQRVLEPVQSQIQLDAVPLDSSLSEGSMVDMDDRETEEKLVLSSPPTTQPALASKTTSAEHVQQRVDTNENSKEFTSLGQRTNAQSPGGQIVGTSSTGRGVSSSHPKSKRGGLVKPNRAPPGTRSAERAIPAAAYGAQHHQINSEMAHSTATGAISAGHAASLNSDTSAGSVERSPRSSPTSGPVRYTGRGLSPSASSASDEHTWLGSQRRTAAGEERKSDPTGERERHAEPQRTLQRASEPQRPFADGWTKERMTEMEKFSKRSTTSEDDELRAVEETRSASMPLLQRGEKTLEPSALLNLVEASDPNSAAADMFSLGQGDAHEYEEQATRDASPHMFLASGSKETNAMLDAARQSQSRRR